MTVGQIFLALLEFRKIVLDIFWLQVIPEAIAANQEELVLARDIIKLYVRVAYDKALVFLVSE